MPSIDTRWGPRQTRLIDANHVTVAQPHPPLPGCVKPTFSSRFCVSVKGLSKSATGNTEDTQIDIVTSPAAVVHSMEPFGVAAGIIGIGDVGTRLYVKVRDARRAWKSTSTELAGLEDSIEDVNILIDGAQYVCSQLQAQPSVRNGRLTGRLERTVQSADDILRELEIILDDMAVMTDTKRKATWLRRKSHVLGKVSELASVRANIREVLQISGFFIGTQTLHQTLSLGLALEESQRGVVQETVTSDACTQQEASDQTPALVSTPTDTPLLVNEGNSPASGIDWGAYRKPSLLCRRDCQCICHSAGDRRWSWSTPRALRVIAGTWQVASNFSPAGTGVCDDRTCRSKANTTYQLHYHFPKWLVAWGVTGILSSLAGASPSRTLRFRPRVKFAAGNIFWATRVGSADDVERLTREHPECVHIKALVNGRTALSNLTINCSSGLERKFKAIFRAGPDLYDEDDFGVTVAAQVAEACLAGCFSADFSRFISTMLPMTKIFDDLDLAPVTKIMLGIQQGDLRTALVNSPVWHQVDTLDGTGSAPIHWACRLGNVVALQQLISFGANVDLPSIYGCPPLGEACKASRPTDCIQALFEAGADPCRADYRGRSTYTRICGLAGSVVVRALFERFPEISSATNSDGDFVLHQLAQYHSVPVDHEQVICIVLRAGMDVNQRNRSGMTPLMAAALYDNSEICKALLQNEADVTLIDKFGFSCFHHAALGGGENTIRVLEEALNDKVDVLDTNDDKFLDRMDF